MATDLSRSELINTLIYFSGRAPRKAEVLKVVRKKKNYTMVADEILADDTYCSNVLNEAASLGLVTKITGERGFFRQVPALRAINIDSELRKARRERNLKQSTKQRQNSTSRSEKTKVIKVLDFEKALERLDLDPEILGDCFPLTKPYRKHVGEAYLTIETTIKKELSLPPHLTGLDVISEAGKKQVFARKVQAEADGLNLLYRGAVLWLRNPSHHTKDKISKEDALKMIWFADYMIKLFRKQVVLNNFKVIS